LPCEFWLSLFWPPLADALLIREGAQINDACKARLRTSLVGFDKSSIWLKAIGMPQSRGQSSSPAPGRLPTTRRESSDRLVAGLGRAHRHALLQETSRRVIPTFHACASCCFCQPSKELWRRLVSAAYSRPMLGALSSACLNCAVKALSEARAITLAGFRLKAVVLVAAKMLLETTSRSFGGSRICEPRFWPTLA
jgi:hypothetical protein